MATPSLNQRQAERRLAIERLPGRSWLGSAGVRIGMLRSAFETGRPGRRRDLGRVRPAMRSSEPDSPASPRSAPPELHRHPPRTPQLRSRHAPAASSPRTPPGPGPAPGCAPAGRASPGHRRRVPRGPSAPRPGSPCAACRACAACRLPGSSAPAAAPWPGRSASPPSRGSVSVIVCPLFVRSR